jgi:hypothetical protein
VQTPSVEKPNRRSTGSWVCHTWLANGSLAVWLQQGVGIELPGWDGENTFVGCILGLVPPLFPESVPTNQVRTAMPFAQKFASQFIHEFIVGQDGQVGLVTMGPPGTYIQPMHNRFPPAGFRVPN